MSKPETINFFEPPINSYGGMNPEFVKAVWAKRRAAMTEDQLKEAERKRQDALRQKKAIWQLHTMQCEERERKAKEVIPPSFDYYTETSTKPSVDSITKETA